MFANGVERIPRTPGTPNNTPRDELRNSQGVKRSREEPSKQSVAKLAKIVFAHEDSPTVERMDTE